MKPQYLDRERGWVARFFFIKLYSTGLLIRIGKYESTCIDRRTNSDWRCTDMGAVKYRQGCSVNLGLSLNQPRVKPEPVFKGLTEMVEKHTNWLTAVVHAITRPFVKTAQNYRGRGNR